MRRLLALLALLSFAAPAAGQIESQTSRPLTGVRGLFGGVERDASRYRSLDLSVSLMGGYDDNVTPEGAGGGTVNPRYTENGAIGLASGSLVYRKGREENWFSAGGRAAFRYYAPMTSLSAADYSGNVSFTASPSARTHLDASQDVSYQPFYSFSTVPVFIPGVGGGLPVMTVDQALVERPSLNYATRVDAGYDLSRRTHLLGAYSFRGLDFTDPADDGRLRRHLARASVTREVTRRTTVGGNYVYEYGDSAYLGPETLVRSHGVEASFDYRRQLRSRRQVSLGFSPGYRWVERTTTSVADRGDERHVTLSARASIELARTWLLRGGYMRGLRYLPPLADPYFTDNIQLGLSGLVNRRVDLAVWGQYSNGSPGGTTSQLTTADGTAQLRFAITRTMALFGTYIFQRYEYGPDLLVPEGLDRRFNRHAVRVGLDFWLPLYR